MLGKSFEDVMGAPADMLDKAVEGVKNNVQLKKANDYWKALGPGLTTGASDDDPSGIATYSQTGAGYGFQLLWLAAFTFPLMAVVQEMCARIGIVTGKGLAANIRDHFSKPILYVCTLCLVAANVFNIGADIGAMAKASQLLFPKLDFAVLVFGFALASLALQIFSSYEKYAKYLKWLALILLSYVFSTLSDKSINWSEVWKHMIVPTIAVSKDQIILICAILGTTISPYLFFWQTSQEVEEQILHGEAEPKKREVSVDGEIKKMRVDVWSGMFLSNLVMFFIITSCAATLYSAGITNITSAAEAAAALRPLAGEQAYILFTLGILGAGMLAIPVLAGSASYALSEAFGWKFGLYRKLKEANAFYGVIIIATSLGVILNFVGFDSMKALLLSAVFNGLVAPLILTLIILLSSNKAVMGKRINRKSTTIIGWLITGMMTVTGVATILSLF